MRLFFVFILSLGILGIFVYILMDYLKNDPTAPAVIITPETSTLAGTGTTTEATKHLPNNLSTFSNSFISFDYPNNLLLKEDPGDVAFFSITSEDANDFFILKGYKEETPLKTFDEYLYSLEADSFGAGDMPEGGNFHYVTETYNDLPVIIYKRDYNSMIGEVNELYIWLGNGTVVKLYTETEHPALETIFKSVRRP